MRTLIVNKKPVYEASSQPENLTKKFVRMKEKSGQAILAVCFGYNTPPEEQIDAEALDKIINWLDKNTDYPRAHGQSAYHICLFLNKDNPQKLQEDLLKVKAILASYPNKFYSFDTESFSAELQAIAPPSWKEKYKKEWNEMYAKFEGLLAKYSSDLEPLIAKDGERFVKVYGKKQDDVRRGIIEETVFLLMQLRSGTDSQGANILFHTHDKIFNIMSYLLHPRGAGKPNYCDELGLEAATLDVISLKYAQWKQGKNQQQRLSNLQQFSSNNDNAFGTAKNDKGKEKDEPITQDQHQITIKKGETTMRVTDSQSIEESDVDNTDSLNMESPEHSDCSTPYNSSNSGSDEEGEEDRMDAEDEDFSNERIEHNQKANYNQERADKESRYVDKFLKVVVKSLVPFVRNADDKEVEVVGSLLAVTVTRLAQAKANKPAQQTPSVVSKPAPQTPPVVIPSSSNASIHKRLSSLPPSPLNSPPERSPIIPKGEVNTEKRRVRSGELPTHVKPLQSCGFHSPKQQPSTSGSLILVEDKISEERVANSW